MNKDDIEWCPFCHAVLHAAEIKQYDEDEFEIWCDFCGGIYGITEKMASPLTQEQVRMKFQGIPLIEKKPRKRRKKK